MNESQQWRKDGMKVESEKMNKDKMKTSTGKEWQDPREMNKNE